MKEIIFEDVTKTYNNVSVIEGLNLKIDSGRRVILLGPSGSGKSTILRMIAGLEDLTGGNLIMNGRVVNNVPSRDRNLAMVFQNYALYPHMSVLENISYALKLKKVPKDQINARVKNTMEMLELSGLENRKPRELSGGQMQRVALARAVVKNADYFLLDEPLSNLDAQLRLKARRELVKLHERFNMTFVYVTHDQVEAMTMGEEIVLLKKGKVQMIAPPEEIYSNPTNVFTAKFIGSPAMNIIDAKYEENSSVFDGEVQKFALSERLKKCVENNNEKEFYLGIRPEDIKITDENESNSLKVQVLYTENIGGKNVLYFTLGSGEYNLVTTGKEYKKNDIIHINFPDKAIILFDKKTEKNISSNSD